MTEKLQKVRWTLAALLLFVGGFGWGLMTIRLETFPFDFLMRFYEGRPPEGDGVATKKTVASPSPALAALRALPYASRTFDPDSHLLGVVERSERAFPGFNLYAARTQSAGHLIDMSGRVVHTWEQSDSGPWQHVDLLEDGDLLVIEKDVAIRRVDLRSRLEWETPGAFHHDLEVSGDRIFVLERRDEVLPAIHPEATVLHELVTALDLETGRRLGSWSILELVERSRYSYLLPLLGLHEWKPSDGPLDILHTNHVEEIRNPRLPEAWQGGFLVSARNVNAIFVVSPDFEEILWLWGPGNLTLQHHPTVTEAGSILLFDNGRTQSRVVELAPSGPDLIWEYTAAGFFSKTRGSVQRLPNGNTLITESDPGYVFEVAPDGEVVWRFANPDITAEGERAAIWRMTRFSKEELPFLPADMEP